MNNKVSRFFKTIIRNMKKMFHHFDKNIIFSIGENCLTDNILERYHLKSFSSPYSSGRSNVEYILNFENEEMLDFLNPTFLKYEYFNDKRVVRNKKYVNVVNKYNETVTNGFEFTHHDVLGNKRIRNQLFRRCDRLKRLKKKNIILVYHHRFCTGTDANLLCKHLNQLADVFKRRNNTVHVFAFTQKLDANNESRWIEKHFFEGVNYYILHTITEWQGENQDIFWARCDDDLIQTMVDDIKNVML